MNHDDDDDDDDDIIIRPSWRRLGSKTSSPLCYRCINCSPMTTNSSRIVNNKKRPTTGPGILSSKNF